MGVNDYGGPTDSLAAVPLGGVGGWAEAVAAALNNDDTTVDDRIASRTFPAGIKIGTGTFAGTTDANGILAINFSSVGLSTATAAVGGPAWSALYNGTAAHWGQARIANGRIEVLCLGLTGAATGSQVKVMQNTAVTVSVIAWGT